jgi:glycerol uptake facilitator-like aquaporin
MIRERAKIAMVVAEFLGTAVLTLVVLSVTRIQGSPFFVALATGLALAAMVLVLRTISGAHLNPAITIGLLTARRVKVLPAAMYIIAQLLGGWMAYVLYTYFLDVHIPNSGHFDSRVLVAEAAGAFVFSLGWAAQIYNRYEGGKAAFVIGGSLAVGMIIASLASAGVVNPAAALGLRLWGWGTYILGPLLGAVIGFNLYALLFAPVNVLVDAEVADSKKHAKK